MTQEPARQRCTCPEVRLTETERTALPSSPLFDGVVPEFGPLARWPVARARPKKRRKRSKRKQASVRQKLRTHVENLNLREPGAGWRLQRYYFGKGYCPRAVLRRADGGERNAYLSPQGSWKRADTRGHLGGPHRHFVQGRYCTKPGCPGRV